MIFLCYKTFLGTPCFFFWGVIWLLQSYKYRQIYNKYFMSEIILKNNLGMLLFCLILYICHIDIDKCIDIFEDDFYLILYICTNTFITKIYMQDDLHRIQWPFRRRVTQTYGRGPSANSTQAYNPLKGSPLSASISVRAPLKPSRPRREYKAFRHVENLFI